MGVGAAPIDCRGGAAQPLVADADFGIGATSNTTYAINPIVNGIVVN
jgi:hypothetical protein